MHEREWPEDGELVVCTVADVKDFAAFVTLDEYNGRRGLIPISEIARGWIKYIRDYIREGQNEQKATKWVGFAAEATGVDRGVIDEAIYHEYGLLYPAFEDIVTTGGEAAERLKLDERIRESLITIAHDNVKVPRVTITGHLVLMSPRPDGVNVIRRALRSAQPKIEDVEIDLVYIGAPKYRIKVTAPDYKAAEKAIEKAANAAVGVVERAGGSGKFIRKQKAG